MYNQKQNVPASQRRRNGSITGLPSRRKACSKVRSKLYLSLTPQTA